MPKLRIVYDNAADRAATISASTTSGGLVVSNLQNNHKSKVHRSTGTSVTYTLTWTSSETVGAIILPCTNLSSTATINIKLFSDAAGASKVADSGTVLATYFDEVIPPTNVNRFAFGEYSKSSVWFSVQPSNVKSCVITIIDTNNPAGFIDCSRLVIGKYWSPSYNFEPGLTREPVDPSETIRAYSGDTRAQIKPRYEKLSFNFSYLPESDYKELNRILNYVGTTANFAISMLPEYGSNKVLENYYLIYGKRANTSYSYSTHKVYKSQLEIESW